LHASPPTALAIEDSAWTAAAATAGESGMRAAQASESTAAAVGRDASASIAPRRRGMLAERTA